MSIFRVGARLIGCAVILGSMATGARANSPTVAQMLTLKPKQVGVPISTPTDAEIAGCKVELVKGGNGSSGWLLRDPRGNILRRFFDSTGSKNIDVWSYYADGQEIYREIDSNHNGKADQYRWLNQGGMRWGVDLNEDGKIDRWEQISPEEVSQEVLACVVNRDSERLRALMVIEADLKKLELPDAEANRIRESIARSMEKFNKTTAALIQLTNKTQWMHLETAAPQCLPPDATGANQDVIRYKAGTVLYQNADKHDWLQIGEMILIGRAWKIIDAPVPGYNNAVESADNRGQKLDIDPSMQPLLKQLQDLDSQSPRVDASPADVVRYNLSRASILEKIAEKDKANDRESWLRQIADCLSAAAQNSPANDKSSLQRLGALRERVAKDASSNLAAYVAFREMSAEYASQLAGGKDTAKVQEAWRERLKKFVADYPTADDSADALLQLGMVSEFVGKETEAKNWYDQLAKQFPKSALAAKAQGALKRLTLDGQEMELAGPVLGNQRPFSISELRGKVVIVYYWASWNGQCAADFARLKTLLNTYGSKGLELVGVNLDNSAGEAMSFLQRAPIQGVQLYQQPGGLDSPLAVQYGVMVLPNLFLVGKDGKVVSHTVQMGGLEDEIKKLILNEKGDK